jgi:hypothetical protein
MIQSPNIQIAGGIPDLASHLQAEQTQALNGMSCAGGFNFKTNSGTTATLTDFSNNAFYQWTAGAGTTITIDYAYNICKLLPQPLSLGQMFSFWMQTTSGTTIATPTLSSTNGGVTLAGTTSMLASALRAYNGTITQVTSVTQMPMTAGSTFTSLTQVGSTNDFTVVLGTNALVPVAGQLIYIGTTTGTLPAGWYPICFVTSATSFVIMTPAGTVWTCTAATLNIGASPPAPVYSPLITITGMFTVGASCAV